VGEGALKIEVSLRNASLFTLSRHHLLERATRSQALDVVDEILGLNAQGAINVQMSLWNRVEDLDTSFISQALYADRTLVKTWVMRDTVHVIPTMRLPIYRRALEHSLMMEWNRWTVRTGTKESATSWEPLYSEVLDALEDSPWTIRQLQDAMGWSGIESRRLLSRLVREMSLRGLICHAISSGPWHHATGYTFARVDKWLPNVNLDSVSEEEALRSLARRYLAAYGPASIRDCAYWTGMRMREARPIFDSMSDSLVEVVVPEHRGTLLIHEDDASDLLDAAERPVYARLLPQFDALIMGHMLVDGRVQGVWTLRRGKKLWRLELSPFNKLSEEDVEGVEAEVERLQKFTSFETELRWNVSSQALSS